MQNYYPSRRKLDLPYRKSAIIWQLIRSMSTINVVFFFVTISLLILIRKGQHFLSCLLSWNKTSYASCLVVFLLQELCARGTTNYQTILEPSKLASGTQFSIQVDQTVRRYIGRRYLCNYNIDNSALYRSDGFWFDRCVGVASLPVLSACVRRWRLPHSCYQPLLRHHVGSGNAIYLWKKGSYERNRQHRGSWPFLPATCHRKRFLDSIHSFDTI